MLPLALLPAPADVALDGVALDGATLTLSLRTTSASAVCPGCGVPSHHAHSRYTRTVRDLPSQGRRTVLRLTARRFFCRNPDCPRSIFCERLPELAPPHARSSPRLADSHRAIAFALGGEAGSRLAGKLGMPTSADTLLRRIKQAATQEVPTPRVLGVDDWAIRRGHVYGTILVDLERHEVIDLLPGRDGPELRAWLHAHPGVEVISRDRSTAYASAASEAAPDAVQVADRWHLLKNLREMLERLFERHHAQIRAALGSPAQPLAPADHTPDRPKQEPADLIAGPVPPIPQEATNERADQQAKRQRRAERHEEARRRHGQGQSIRLIAKEMGLSRGAVRRYLRQDQCPDWRPGRAGRSRLDGFRAWIDEQILAGRHNGSELHRELVAKGYGGSATAVRRFVTKRLAALGKRRQRANAARPRSPPAPSARELSFGVLRAEQKRKAEVQARVDALRQIGGEFAGTLALAERFIALVRKEGAGTLADWLTEAEASASAELRGFALGVRQDERAVSAAITEEWSNGPVEGAVNRLKTIKRQMYGRASFDLLRRRVLHAN